jgi:hypothetical protein
MYLFVELKRLIMKDVSFVYVQERESARERARTRAREKETYTRAYMP